MSNLKDVKNILDIYQTTKDRYYHILFSLVLFILITVVFSFLGDGYWMWICFGFMMILGLFLIFFKKNDKKNEFLNTNETQQLEKVKVYTELHKTIGDTDKTTEVFGSFFPNSGDNTQGKNLQLDNTETDKDFISIKN